MNSLRAFESAARLSSFTKAAEELSVTQSAVSHQVKALEDWAGMPLFRRDGRQMALTEAAGKFLPAVSLALDQIALASRRLQAVDPGQRWLTVAMMPSFAGKYRGSRTFGASIQESTSGLRRSRHRPARSVPTSMSPFATAKAIGRASQA